MTKHKMFCAYCKEEILGKFVIFSLPNPDNSLKNYYFHTGGKCNEIYKKRMTLVKNIHNSIE